MVRYDNRCCHPSPDLSQARYRQGRTAAADWTTIDFFLDTGYMNQLGKISNIAARSISYKRGRWEIGKVFECDGRNRPLQPGNSPPPQQPFFIPGQFLGLPFDFFVLIADAGFSPIADVIDGNDSLIVVENMLGATDFQRACGMDAVPDIG